MLDARSTHFAQAPQVARWAFDSSARQINALDHQGRMLMAIPTGPLFAARLAAAFNGPLSLDTRCDGRWV